MPKRLKTTQQSKSGRNLKFKDNFTGEEFTRAKLVQKIEAGSYQNYHIRKINNVKTPVSNPDSTRNNNLD